MLPASPAGRRFTIFSWSLFDFANTAYSVIVVTVIYPRYFQAHVAGGRNWLWGAAVSLSMICAAALSPPLGAAADGSHSKKLYLFIFTLASVVCTALLFFVGDGMLVPGIIFFVIANIGFEGGLVFYDAFLPSLTSERSYGRVSGYGFAMGYAGALAVLGIVIALLPDASNPDYLFFVRLSFIVAAAFFLFFSLPIFLFVPEPRRREGQSPVRHAVRAGLSQAARTFRVLFVRKEHPAIARFLIAFFIYNDGILTVISFAAVFASQTLKMDDKAIIIFFAVVQTSAILGSVVFGFLTDRIGPKRTISLTLLIWIVICIGAFFVDSVAVFYAVGLAAGIAIGSSQSASRSLMALLTPKEREAEFFGFYDGLCGKASAVIGPLIYGLVADLTNQRFAALAIGVFFITGLTVLQRVPDRRAEVVE